MGLPRLRGLETGGEELSEGDVVDAGVGFEGAGEVFHSDNVFGVGVSDSVEIAKLPADGFGR